MISPEQIQDISDHITITRTESNSEIVISLTMRRFWNEDWIENGQALRAYELLLSADNLIQFIQATADLTITGNEISYQYKNKIDIVHKKSGSPFTRVPKVDSKYFFSHRKQP
jgi:hypothetical protein